MLVNIQSLAQLIKSVSGFPSRHTSQLDPGCGRGMGGILYLCGSKRGCSHSVIRWATNQLAPSEGVRYVNGCQFRHPVYGGEPGTCHADGAVGSRLCTCR